MEDSLIDYNNIFTAREKLQYMADSISQNTNINSSLFPTPMNMDIQPIMVLGMPYHVIGVILLTIMLALSALWYSSPNLIVDNFSALSFNPFKRTWDSASNKSGLVVNSILYLNFLIVFSTLVFFIVNRLSPNLMNLKLDLGSLVKIISVLSALILFRLIYVKISGFIFQTNEMSRQQNKLYNSLEKTMGIITLPLLFFYLYADGSIFLIISLLVFVLFVIVRWVFTMAIGLRITKFSWFHIILYLCTLEIVPFLLLIKLLENGVFFKV